MKQFNGSKEDLARSIEKKQKSLMPVNIAVMIISLIAAISLLVAPLISIDMSGMSEVITAAQGGSTGNNADSDSGQTDQGSNSQSEAMEEIGTLASNVFGNISINATTLLGMSMQPNISEAFGGYLGDMLEQADDKMVTEAIVPVLLQQMQQNTDLPELENPQAVLDKFNALGEADEQNVDAKIAELTEEVQKQAGKEVFPDSYKEDFSNTIRTIYDTTVENNDGNFNTEACVCVLASQTIANGAEDAVICTTYKELANQVTSKMFEGTTGEGGSLENAMPLIKILAYSMLFFAALWAILFVFALVRTFTKNKFLLMWYVKLFGFWPCLIFFVMPLIAKAVIPSVVGESGAYIATALGMVSSMTWISGACYLLLWIISIFWAFPIKSKIRAYRKQYSAMN